MSILNSYFSRNNTIIENSFTNTGRNPVMELYFGSNQNSFAPYSYSRFIFNLDLNLLQEKIASGEISTDCTSFSSMTHTLKMRNTSSFDEALLNTTTSAGSQRATSFDLVLLRIPNISGGTGSPQTWDEGVGYDFSDMLQTQNSYLGSFTNNTFFDTDSYSDRPSNFYQRNTIDNWSFPGIYDNTNSLTGLTGCNYSALTIVDEQHFEFGNEDIEFDMSNEINSILDGTLTGVTGWVIAYKPQFENITGLTNTYSVGFFTRHTQTFYEPYLETNYDDLIQDNRNNFAEKKVNKLYLYVYNDAGELALLDSNPTVTIDNPAGVTIISGLTTCLKTRGVYEVTIPPISGYTTPCLFTDKWDGVILDGVDLGTIENTFVLLSQNTIGIVGSYSKDPSIFGFDFYGIKQSEKILDTDVRKVGVVIKKAYTAQETLQKISAQYRVYVMEGTTEVLVQDWTNINRTPNEYYFIFNTQDKIPNEYFIDIKVNSSGQVDTYKKQLKFQIVNSK
jgi:hypothetical protein